MMKILRLSTLLALGVIGVWAAEVILEYLNARSDGRAITIEWKPVVERNILRYDLERSNDNRTWIIVTSVDAKGGGAIYRYIDTDVLGKGTENQPYPAGQVYYYRLRVIGSDNTVTYTPATVVTFNLSTVRRTWGMIKEMFK